MTEVTCLLHAKESNFNEHPAGKHSKLVRLGSIAKAVWTADRHLSNMLMSSSDSARQHLVMKEGDISLRDSASFEEEFRVAKLQAGSERMNEIRNEHPDNGGDDGEFHASLQPCLFQFLSHCMIKNVQTSQEGRFHDFLYKNGFT